MVYITVYTNTTGPGGDRSSHKNVPADGRTGYCSALLLQSDYSEQRSSRREKSIMTGRALLYAGQTGEWSAKSPLQQIRTAAQTTHVASRHRLRLYPATG